MTREEFEIAFLNLRGCKKHKVNSAVAQIHWTDSCTPKHKCRQLAFDFIFAHANKDEPKMGSHNPVLPANE